MNAYSPITAAPGPTARQINALRHAERQWQLNAQFDNWPGGNPWADLRDAWADKAARLRSEIDETRGRMRSLAGCIADVEREGR